MSTRRRQALTVLLLGAGGNAGLNFLKCLRMADASYRIVGCDVDRYNLTAAACDAKYLLRRGADVETRIATLRRIIEREQVDFVHAQPDPEVRFLAEHGARLHTRVFDHDLATHDSFADKLSCQGRWKEVLGVGFDCASLADLRQDPARFSALCARSGKAWVRARSGAGSLAALPVRRLEQALHWADYWIEERGLAEEDFMVGEWLDGPEYAVQTLWGRGELLHAQARERLVYFFGERMPSGQSSTPAVAVTVDERRVYDAAYAAIRALSPVPHGIHCVDLKTNAAGEIVPMEVNYGRFFTTSDFFARLGVNTPHAYVEYTLTGTCDRRVESLPGGTYWLRGLDREPVLAHELVGETEES